MEPPTHKQVPVIFEAPDMEESSKVSILKGTAMRKVIAGRVLHRAQAIVGLESFRPTKYRS